MPLEHAILLIHQLLASTSHLNWFTLLVLQWRNRFLNVLPISLLLNKAFLITDIKIHGLLFKPSHVIFERVLVLVLKSQGLVHKHLVLLEIQIWLLLSVICLLVVVLLWICIILDWDMLRNLIGETLYRMEILELSRGYTWQHLVRLGLLLLILKLGLSILYLNL
jgi:hypothetical protein